MRSKKYKKLDKTSKTNEELPDDSMTLHIYSSANPTWSFIFTMSFEIDQLLVNFIYYNRSMKQIKKKLRK